MCSQKASAQVLEERARARQPGGGPQVSAQRLYNAVNAQTSVAQAQVHVAFLRRTRMPTCVLTLSTPVLMQLERLEELWTRLQGLGLEDEPFPHGVPSARAVTPPSAPRCAIC